MEQVFKVAAAVLRTLQAYIVMITGMAASLLIVAAAVMRYVFSVDFYGSDELIMFTAFWLYFMGASLASREDSHISADLITSFLKTRRQRLKLKVVQHSLSLLVSGTAISWSYQYISWSLARMPKTPVLKFPVVLLQFPILVFFILSTLYIFKHLVDDIRSLIAEGERS